jgi:RNA polymerase sigma-70 factor (ECF subfamily)
LSAEDIYRQYGLRVYGIAIRMLGNEADAEDVTQEVLLQVIRRLDTFRGESALSTWLYRVTVNVVLALRRKRASGRERQFDAAGGEGEYAASGRRDRPAVAADDAAVVREQRERVEAAIAELPEMYRDVFILADVEQLANAEIVEISGLSLSAVKSRLHRARQMLRDALQGYLGVPVAPES